MKKFVLLPEDKYLRLTRTTEQPLLPLQGDQTGFVVSEASPELEVLSQKPLHSEISKNSVDLDVNQTKSSSNDLLAQPNDSIISNAHSPDTGVSVTTENTEDSLTSVPPPGEPETYISEIFT